MGFTKFTKNVLNVSALPDRVQNQASSLKLVFDQAGVDIKAALNALISELEAKVAAANIGADVASVTEKTVQGILTAFENEIANRYTKAETNNAILADTNELIADVKIDLATGLLTVTKKNGTKQTFETSTEAESYAVGGTGTRPGEDTDNAKYYAQIAKQVAGGDFVTVVEMEGYAQKKGLYPNYNKTELKGEVIETETTLEAESVLKVHGNSVQETRSGKNLLKKSAGDYVSKTSNGITFTINDDESVTINGTNNGVNNSVVYLWNSSSNPYTIPAGTYKFKKTGHKDVGVVGYDGSKYYSLSDNYTGTLTLSSDTAFKQIYLQIAQNATDTFTNFTVYPILVKDTDSLEPYEPYGVKPSPEFESHIKSVKSKSDNLFDISKKTDNAVFTWGTGANYSTTGAVLTDYISTNGIKEISSNYPFNIAFYDTNKNYLGSGPELSKVYNESAKKLIIPNNNNIAYCRICYYPIEKSDMTTVTDIMLNKGTTALPYQPYGYVDAEARVEGENELNLKSFTYGFCSIPPTLNNGVINVKGSDNVDYPNKGASRNGYIGIHAIDELEVGATYYISCDIDVKSNQKNLDTSYFGCMLGGDGTFAFRLKKTENGIRYTGKVKISKPLATRSIEFRIDGCELNISNFMVSKKDSYVYDPYKLTTISLPLGDIELRSTPDGTRDTFARVDGVWNYRADAGSVIFDGVNNKFESKSGSTANTIWMSVATYEVENGAIVMCNRFGGNSGNLYDRDGIGVYAENKRLKFAFGLNSELTTLELANNWLVNNPLHVIYPTTTPTYTPITDQALISALDELEQLVLHKGYNRITVTGVNGVKAYLELDIAPTASTTNVSETETGLDMIVPVVSETGDVLVKVPMAENQMTINPATGVVNVKGLSINGVSLDAYIRSIIG